MDRRTTTIALLLGALLITPGLGPDLYGSDPGTLTIARVKYGGGGDWYNDRSAEVNLLRYVAEQTNIAVNPVFEPVELSSDELFGYPLLFLTGHGNIRLTGEEVEYLQAYLNNGGFLYVDDDYGLDTAIRREMRRVFPEQDFLELPFSHDIYHSFFNFDGGLPKIHEHDGKEPRGYGLFDESGRLAVFYTWETNPSDGWADPSAHGDTPEKREAALRLGTNIVVYALTH